MALAAFAGPAQGAVTIGSNLAGATNDNMPGCNNPCTAINLALPITSQAANGVVSPVNGTVTSWRAKANTNDLNDNIGLQVLRPVSGTTFTGVATSTAQNWPPQISPAFTTSLPIKTGDATGFAIRVLA